MYTKQYFKINIQFIINNCLVYVPILNIQGHMNMAQAKGVRMKIVWKTLSSR